MKFKMCYVFYCCWSHICQFCFDSSLRLSHNYWKELAFLIWTDSFWLEQRQDLVWNWSLFWPGHWYYQSGPWGCLHSSFILVGNLSSINCKKMTGTEWLVLERPTARKTEKKTKLSCWDIQTNIAMDIISSSPSWMPLLHRSQFLCLYVAFSVNLLCCKYIFSPLSWVFQMFSTTMCYSLRKGKIKNRMRSAIFDNFNNIPKCEQKYLIIILILLFSSPLALQALVRKVQFYFLSKKYFNGMYKLFLVVCFFCIWSYYSKLKLWSMFLCLNLAENTTAKASKNTEELNVSQAIKKAWKWR